MGENESGTDGSRQWMEAGAFSILYEEGPVLAVNKESGILTQAPAGIDSLEARVKAFLIRRGNKTGRVLSGDPAPARPPRIGSDPLRETCTRRTPPFGTVPDPNR